MLRRNDSDSYPGATHFAFAPVSAGDCCLRTSTAELAEALSAAGHPYTFRGGRVYFEISDADLVDVCDGLEPVITALDNEPVTEFVANAAIGLNFSADAGSCWITDAATWAGSVVRVEQGGLGVTPTRFDFDPVPGGLPRAPTFVYVYVFNGCGRANAVGFETTFAP